MKKFLVCLIMAVCSGVSFAQIHNFGVSEAGKVYWQKVYEDARSADAVVSAILSSGSFSGITEGEGSITFHIDPRPVDVTALGYRRMSVPMYTVNYDFSGQATLQFQEGRYRVTVQDMILMDSEGSEPIEFWAVSRGNMTRGFSATPSEIYDKFLDGLFGPQSSPLDNDW